MDLSKDKPMVVNSHSGYVKVLAMVDRDWPETLCALQLDFKREEWAARVDIAVLRRPYNVIVKSREDPLYREYYLCDSREMRDEVTRRLDCQKIDEEIAEDPK